MSLLKLGAEDLAALHEVAAQLGLEPKKLATEIDFETAGSWDPKKKNPYSSATGLLQFINSTAQRLHYTEIIDGKPTRLALRSAAHLAEVYPTVASQLRGPVLEYLSQFKPFPTDVSLAMAVFYPAARHWPESREFPADVQRVNPGIRTVGDYVSRLRVRLVGVELALASLAQRFGDVAGQAAPAAGGALAGLAFIALLLAASQGSGRG